ncbi:unnamed protein product [Schistosoma rodhaini]|uniref:U2 small nuclear ribonucleoprotein A' n=1 Tax=Schistosoma mansoni TaxID=6183 RepID=G4V7P9_SCHMA|nr:hypothetical protein Smp_141330 [Schistosoma mansoni]CAH8442769.1 unnamed protein product [Schistosoma rodhaini]|eukprot:XP_018647840.1 hypothetical protein Smp_141330 [Schistosoma mansoni]
MVRITSEIVENAPQFTNAIKDRELSLRSYKFPAIENMGCTLDQFDTIDLSDNEIRKLDGFPMLKRLKSLILTNNKIARIAEDLGQHLPNLLTLILTSNYLSDLKDLDPLSSCDKLNFLSLLHCPVTMRANYRLYVISRVASLRFLDYRRVTQAERKLARSMFKRLPALSNSVNNLKAPYQKANSNRIENSIPAAGVVKTFIPGAPINSNNLLPPGTEPTRSSNEQIHHGEGKENNAAALNTSVETDQTESTKSDTLVVSSADTPMPPPSTPVTTGNKRPVASSQDLFAIQEAIKRARTMDEVERLHQLLSSGQFAGFAAQWQKQLRQQQQQKSSQ